MGRSVILVTSEACAPSLEAVVRAEDADATLHVLTGRKGVTNILNELIVPDSLLVCFSTGVIISAALLGRLARTGYNFHAASPSYPGRDPHHFAVYEGAKWYGATAHKLAPKVDSGPIVGVDRFRITPGTTPEALCAMATAATLRLYRVLMPRMMSEDHDLPEIGVAWGPRKRNRRDFSAMCRLEPTIGREEIERRYFAFGGGKYDNLVLDLHGRSFRICKAGGADICADRITCRVEPTIDQQSLETHCRALKAGEIHVLTVVLHDRIFQLELGQEC